jgi:hypothetical protein
MHKTSHTQRGAAYEPLYDFDQHTGAIIEVFYADHVLAGMKGAGWHWWSCKPGSLPEWPPNGPFPTGYSAYRDARGASSTRGSRTARRYREPYCS